jgi:hypothetical protein
MYVIAPSIKGYQRKERNTVRIGFYASDFKEKGNMNDYLHRGIEIVQPGEGNGVIYVV